MAAADDKPRTDHANKTAAAPEYVAASEPPLSPAPSQAPESVESEESTTPKPAQKPKARAKDSAKPEAEPATDQEVSIFSGQTAANAGMGCLAGSCGPDAVIGMGFAICGGGLVLGVLGGPSGFLLGMLAAIVGIPIACLGGICAGPMGAGGAMIGGAIGAALDQRAWWLPIAAGAPGLLVGLLGTGLLLTPLAIGFVPFQNVDATASSAINYGVYAAVLAGLVAAVAAGPISLAGVVVADSMWGVSQQAEQPESWTPEDTDEDEDDDVEDEGDYDYNAASTTLHNARFVAAY